MKLSTLVLPDRVAARALGLSAVVCRETMESAKDDPHSGEMHDLIIRWIERHDLADALEAKEIDILKAPVGKLSRDDRARAFWRLDQLTILAWALGKVPFPSPWERYAGRWVARRVGFLRNDADMIIKKASLVPAEHVARCSAITDLERNELIQVYRTKPSPAVAAALCAVEQRCAASAWLLGEQVEPARLDA
jgi:uncharacterized protein DUF4272